MGSLKVKTYTRSGLPAGPAGLLVAAEGLSYLSFLGGRWLLGGLWRALGCLCRLLGGMGSLKEMNDEGYGLPAGPAGLLVDAEGLSFLSFL
eukprot:gene24663-10289_t